MKNPPQNSIVHVADFSAQYSGNFLHSLIALHKALHEQLNYNLVLVLPTTAKNRPWLQHLKIQNIRLYFIEKNQSLIKRFLRLKKITKQTHAVVIHSHFTTFDFEVVLVGLLIGVKSVWHLHSPVFAKYRFRQRAKDAIKMRLFANSFLCCLIAVSDSIATEAVRRGCRKRKVKTIFNGIDVARLQHNGESRQQLRDRYRIAHDDRLFLMFAWDPFIKGVDIVAQAWRLAQSSHCNLKCLVVGPHEHPMVAQALENNPGVTIISPVENVAELYGMADYFVSASRFEGFPYSISEAMACGLPVIASDIDSIAFYKQRNLGFFTFEQGDASGLSNLIKNLSCETPERLQMLGESNRAFVENKLSLKTWCNEILTLYRLMTDKSGRHTARL